MHKRVFFLLVFVSVAIFADDLPHGYRSIQLGMNLESVKSALKSDFLFGYRGERDVSLLPTENRVLIETTGSNWIDESWFQFYKNQLYIIIVNFNTEKLDHYSIFTRLVQKYGEPDVVSPEKIQWEDSTVIVSLEQPLSLKYIDKPVFNALRDAVTVEKATEERVREKLLEAL